MRQKSNPALDEVKYGVAQIRMYPTTAQKTYFWRLFGANRWLWNQIKDMTDKRYQNNKNLLFPSTASLKKLLPRLKQEYPWLKKQTPHLCRQQLNITAMPKKPSSSRHRLAESHLNLKDGISTAKVPL